MTLRFSRENMFTVAGFVLDSFTADRADFAAVSATDFSAAFGTAAQAARQRIKGATGGALRAGGTAQTTGRLYENLEKLKPLLDRLDIRLGLLPASGLTVAAKKFGLKTLRDRINARDAEAVSRALVVLAQALADNQAALLTKGHTAADTAQLAALHAAIDADNAAQNTGFNANIGSTSAEDADYQALDVMLGKIMRTGRLLYKTNKQKRRQYEAASLLKRVQATRLGDEGAPAA